MKYDLILPIGERCHTHTALKKIFPDIQPKIFDALGNLSLVNVYRALSDNFEGFLEKENIEVLDKGDGVNYYTKDIKTDIRISHLFSTTYPPAESINKLYPVLFRVMSSTKCALKDGKTILMVHCTNQYDYSLRKLKSFSKKVRKLYPDKQVDFLFYVYKEPSFFMKLKGRIQKRETDRPKQIYFKKGICVYRMGFHPENGKETAHDMTIWSNMEKFTGV